MGGYGHAGWLQGPPRRPLTSPERPRPIPAAYRPTRPPGPGHCGRRIAQGEPGRAREGWGGDPKTAQNHEIFRLVDLGDSCADFDDAGCFGELWSSSFHFWWYFQYFLTRWAAAGGLATVEIKQKSMKIIDFRQKSRLFDLKS